MDVEKLEVWQHSMEPAAKAYEITVKFPKHEMYSLADHMERVYTKFLTDPISQTLRLSVLEELSVKPKPIFSKLSHTTYNQQPTTNPPPQAQSHSAGMQSLYEVKHNLSKAQHSHCLAAPSLSIFKFGSF
ncbi:hypothetical protein AT15_03810 [Kosmotoga arenicorallina S304]|uniref:Uncharacterized protein n=1 Tax=Kosmotoga arenicorallina S304 TaxID=1453497 RepID=A0A182C845_9BACT|nr:four helix bundle protein [Kosmotoga arenicorallina]OAA31960.1 hypothetical protein AT15_03810 [Kosmotoga arenicorallina S304]